MRYLLIVLIVAITFTVTWSQTQPPATPADQRIKSLEQRKALNEKSLVSNLKFRSVGPTVMSGRVVDIEVSPTDPTHFYVAYASGGVYFTNNNGTSFTPVFDNQIVLTIGDIAVDWKRNIIWVGTGENNSSRSSYSGVGLFKSTDGGKSWEHKGLPESHHIGRIILNPDDANTVWVAALGHLYSPNAERGVYKTTDGGNTWKKILYVDENTGAVDLIIDPRNSKNLYAAMWQKTRRAWNFEEGGKGSGIYTSTDGGETWTQANTPNSGFPNGNGVGRIGLSIFNDGTDHYVYAVLDNQFRREKKADDKKKEGLTKDDLRNMSKADFLKLEKKAIGKFLKQNRFPKKYDVSTVQSMVEQDKIKPNALVEYLEDANSLLFDTPVIGAEVYRSEDEGKTWVKMNEDYIDNVYYSYGYYFGQIRVAAHNPHQIFIMGVPVLRSEDGGKNFKSVQGRNVHADHHALWINPDRPGHVILGNDGGVNISYDAGEHWIKCNSIPLGQFYAVAVDMAKPYNIYGGLQDNGVWKGPSTYKQSDSWHNSGHYPYKEKMGGDGMQVAIDTRDNNIMYTGYQFGNYYRINQQTDETKYIQPKHELGERPLRFNWQTPIHLSVHNQDILYLGSNKLHRSFHQGDDFEAISGDLTKGGKKGDVAFGTLTSISESKFQFGLIYVGTDDGLIHVTKNGGATWTKISDNLPQDMWVTRVYASTHDKATVYVSLNGYRWDDFSAYVYKSTDYGATWTKIGTDLPLEPVNVIKEDIDNPNLLYVGTDHGLYISLDKGASFMGMNGGLPDAAVHDLVIHPREKDLVIGTHGRSIYVTNVAYLQQITNEILAKNAHVFELKKLRYSSRWGRSWSKWFAATPPTHPMAVYAKTNGKATISINTKAGLKLQSFSTEIAKGLNFVDYDLTIKADQIEAYQKELNKDAKSPITLTKADTGQYYIYKGKYTVVMEVNGERFEEELEVK